MSMRAAKAIAVLAAAVAVLAGCGRGGKALDPAAALALIQGRAGISGETARLVFESAASGIPAEALLAGKGDIETLTGGILLLRPGADLDVRVRAAGAAFPAGILKALAANRTASGTTLVGKEDITDVRIIEQAPGSARGSFAWQSPGLVSGRGLFAAAKQNNRWTLTRLAFPRKGSDNPTHGRIIFPAAENPYRSGQVAPAQLRTAAGAPVPAPPGDWWIVNIAKRGDVPAPAGQAADPLAPPAGTNWTCIVRCDAAAHWARVAAALERLAANGVGRVWFMLEAREGGADGSARLEVFAPARLDPDNAAAAAAERVTIDSRAYLSVGRTVVRAVEAEPVLRKLPGGGSFVVEPAGDVWAEYALVPLFALAAGGDRTVFVRPAAR